ncbi:MAG: branched-chain amino acid ABC transporter permease [Acidimicrobiales bacterium]
MHLLIQSIGFGVVTASIIAIAAMGFTLQFGLTNVLNLSYGSIMTAGGFVAYLAQTVGINVWIGLVLGGLAGAAMTIGLGKSVFKVYARRGTKLFEMVMVTLALALVIEYAIDAISRDQIYQMTFPQGSTINIGAISVTESQLALIGIALAIFLLLEGMLRLTRLGKALRAMAVDPSLARSCGIPTDRIVNATWLVSGFLCGAAGVVFVINALSVDSYTGTLFLPSVLAAAILGGVGSPGGAVVASLVLGVVTELVAAYGGSAYSTVAAFGVLVVVLLRKPSGVLTAAARKVELTV